jgi:uncharacterized protein YutE (UPF0331/DUF86 family)
MDEFETIEEKLELLDSYVKRLVSHQAHALEEFLADLDLQWIVERGLQVSIQCVIDVSQALIKKRGLTCPAHPVDAVALLAERQIVTRELGETLVSMVRFRNVVVHAYDHVRPDLVHQFLTTRLGDFDEFSHQISNHLDGLANVEEEDEA